MINIEAVYAAMREEKLSPNWGSKKRNQILSVCPRHNDIPHPEPRRNNLNVKITDSSINAVCKVCGELPDFVSMIGLNTTESDSISIQDTTDRETVVIESNLVEVKRETSIIELPIDSVTVNTAAQSRAEIDMTLVAEYAELMREGIVFPPVTVFFDGEVYWLSEGFHRIAAYREAAISMVPCIVKPGGLREAILQSVGSNAEHGKRRSNADKRRAVEMLMKDEVWRGWSDREIGKQCAVSHEWVRQIRSAMQASEVAHCQPLTVTPSTDVPSSGISQVSEGRTYTTKHGTKATMKIANIGKTKPVSAKPEPEPAKVMPTEEPITSYILLDQWLVLSEEDKEKALKPIKPKSGFNKQDSDSIEWAKWSWNPITGCRANCAFCYAIDIADRLYPQKFEPSFHANRLLAPNRVNVPDSAGNDVSFKNVFTCSMADLFGRWVPSEWIEVVLEQVRNNPQWNFLFLTKYPKRLVEFEFPQNAWMGTTVDCQVRVKSAEDAFERISGGTKWLSIEPLLQPLKFNRLDLFDWMAIGGSSQSTRTPAWVPPFDWIADLHNQARRAGCKIYHKTNLGLTSEMRIKEFPWESSITKALPNALRYLPSLNE